MDPAVVTGIFTLGGVTVGGVLNSVVASAAGRRETTRATTMAARMVVEDLVRWHVALHAAAEVRSLLPVALLNPTLEGWKTYSPTLAAAMNHQEWRLLRVQMRRLENIRRGAPKANDVPLSDAEVHKIQTAHETGMRCAAILDEMATHGVFSRRRRKTTSEQVRSRLVLTPVDFAEAFGTQPPEDQGEADEGPSDDQPRAP